jgi:hypothetical protein
MENPKIPRRTAFAVGVFLACTASAVAQDKEQPAKHAQKPADVRQALRPEKQLQIEQGRKCFNDARIGLKIV